MGWLHWLNTNGPAVTAVVTAVYAFSTILLWRATQRQAALTQRTFEAAHRPYLSMRILEEDTTWAEGDAVRLNAVIENVGTVPAHVTKWEASGTLMDLVGAQQPVELGEGRRIVEMLLGACLFPGREYPIRLEFQHPGILGTPLPLRILLTVEYRGGSETVYQTCLEGERTLSRSRQRVLAT